VPQYWSSEDKVENEDFWSEIYQNEKPPWDLDQPAPALVDMLPRLKLSKSRILVLGCGAGHDAAFFAKAGHVVTAVDFSPEAIERGRKLYGEFKNLQFVEADIFNLPQDMQGSYDLIFEQTCFCAVNPTLRSRLVSIWRGLLAEQGFLMGVFFVNEKKKGPPYGASEWEIRERLKKGFHFVFWGRLKNSIERRYGKELLVYAQKK
jgi:SAM-dependent methyltransferase